MPSEKGGDFSYRALKGGSVQVVRNGRVVQTLKERAAARFLQRVEGLDSAEAQRFMAASTGQYRFGNERMGRKR